MDLKTGRSGKPKKLFNLETKEVALISVTSSLWIVSQIYLGPIIGQITNVHGVVNRLVGWLLMLVLAELTGSFGRVSIMASVAALATRFIRRSASLYALTVGLGYALGGLSFDALFFLPLSRDLSGRYRKTFILVISVISALTALAPYVAYKLFTLGTYGFLASTPLILYYLAKGTLLSLIGTLMGLSILPRMQVVGKQYSDEMMGVKG